ncbi:MAG: hypothetical protein P0107_03345 [Nitrosomonas sp.]|nr:hypothetical protein [Nitrosomonas sp.]
MRIPAGALSIFAGYVRPGCDPVDCVVIQESKRDLASLFLSLLDDDLPLFFELLLLLRKKRFILFSTSSEDIPV